MQNSVFGTFPLSGKEFKSVSFCFHTQQRKAEEDAKKKHETEMDYLAPFLAQIGAPNQLSRAEAYKLKEECLQDLKQRLIDRANLIQARFEKVCTPEFALSTSLRV